MAEIKELTDRIQEAVDALHKAGEKQTEELKEFGRVNISTKETKPKREIEQSWMLTSILKSEVKDVFGTVDRVYWYQRLVLDSDDIGVYVERLGSFYKIRLNC